ncbi:hypothetical protein BC937DRAFT_87849 [Endogone sp. FLAS-F59071]|nr:hypothetical protein BC937DRAFT_87849 [Endogone sp. FLAS-F59071]|eukprot:RUS19197.1 hypothetical protein BC937DRAFT_87849 [Endogone sp. FLAS-F59071]
MSPKMTTITLPLLPSSPSLFLAWKSSFPPSPFLCLDLRSASAFVVRHLVPSTNIPGDELADRWYELPPKQTPFAVVEPKESRDFAAWLVKKGWCVPWVLREEDETVWREANEFGMLWTERGPTKVQHEGILAVSERDPQCVLDLSIPPEPWLLFHPCPFLASNIVFIERSLALRHPPLQQSSSTEFRPWRCLDIGCGSGRDITWLLSRSEARWTATALDAWTGAVERTRALFESMKFGGRVECLAQAKVMADGGWRLISPAQRPAEAQQQELDGVDKNAPPVLADTRSSNSNPNISATPSKKEIFSPGLPTSTFFSHLFPNNSSSPTFDLILTIRFLSRPLLPHLSQLLAPGGFLLVSHFVDDPNYEYDTPRPEHRLRRGELAEIYGALEGLEIVIDKVDKVEDGRPVNSVLVKRKDEEKKRLV